MAYGHLRFTFRRDGVPSIEQGSGGAPAGADPGTIGWNRPTGSVIECVDTGDTYKFDGTNWDQDLNVNSTFSDAADSLDVKIEEYLAVAADSANGVHAAYATGVNVNFPGAFTNPGTPRNVTITCSNLYDGGDITVSGLDVDNVAVSETLTPLGGGGLTTGTKIFKTVTAATQTNVGAGGVTCSIGWGHKIGLATSPAKKVGVLSVNGVDEDATWDNTAQSAGFIPTTLPNGAHNYVATVSKTGATTTVTATA